MESGASSFLSNLMARSLAGLGYRLRGDQAEGESKTNYRLVRGLNPISRCVSLFKTFSPNKDTPGKERVEPLERVFLARLFKVSGYEKEETFIEEDWADYVDQYISGASGGKVSPQTLKEKALQQGSVKSALIYFKTQLGAEGYKHIKFRARFLAFQDFYYQSDSQFSENKKEVHVLSQVVLTLERKLVQGLTKGHFTLEMVEEINKDLIAIREEIQSAREHVLTLVGVTKTTRLYHFSDLPPIKKVEEYVDKFMYIEAYWAFRNLGCYLLDWEKSVTRRIIEWVETRMSKSKDALMLAYHLRLALGQNPPLPSNEGVSFPLRIKESPLLEEKITAPQTAIDALPFLSLWEERVVADRIAIRESKESLEREIALVRSRADVYFAKLEVQVAAKEKEKLEAFIQEYSKQHLDVDVDKSDFSALASDLKEKEEGLHEHLVILEEQIQVRVNKGPESPREKMIFELKRRSENWMYRLDDLIALFVKEKLAELLKDNPNLIEEDIQELDVLIYRYLLLATRWQQINRALHLLKSSKREDHLTEVVEELVAKRAFTPQTKAARSLLAMEYFSGVKIKKTLIDAYEKLLENPNAVVFLGFGEGKSRVLGPMLARARSNGENLIVLLGPQELHAAMLRDQGWISRMLGQETVAFDFDPQQGMSEDELRSFLEKAKRAVVTGGIVRTTPESLHGLQVRWNELALQMKGRRSVKLNLMEEVLFLFKEKGEVIADEVHTLLLIFKEMIIAHGKSRGLKKEEVEVSFHLLDMLMKKGLDIEKGRHLELKEEEVDVYIDSIRKELDLEAMDAEKKKVYVAQFSGALKASLRHISHERYKLSSDQEHVIPASLGKAQEGASFADTLMRINLSFLYLLSNVVKKEQVAKFLEEKKAEIEEEARAEGVSFLETECYKRLKMLFPGVDFSGLSDDISSLIAPFKQLLEKEVRYRVVFLQSGVFRKERIYEEMIMSSAHDLVSMFRAFCGFTATLENKHSWSRSLEPQEKAMSAFQGKALYYLFRDSFNQVVVTDKPLETNSKEVFIDAGGCANALEPQEVAKALCRGRSLVLGVKTLNSQGEEVFVSRYDGVDEFGCPREHVAYFIPQHQCEGSNLVQRKDPFQARISCHPNLLYSVFLQAVGRMRGLGSQKVQVCVLPWQVEHFGLKEPSLTMADLLAQFRRNEEKRSQEATLYSRSCEMRSVLRQSAREKLLQGRRSKELTPFLVEPMFQQTFQNSLEDERWHLIQRAKAMGLTSADDELQTHTRFADFDQQTQKGILPLDQSFLTQGKSAFFIQRLQEEERQVQNLALMPVFTWQDQVNYEWPKLSSASDLWREMEVRNSTLFVPTEVFSHYLDRDSIGITHSFFPIFKFEQGMRVPLAYDLTPHDINLPWLDLVLVMYSRRKWRVAFIAKQDLPPIEVLIQSDNERDRGVAFGLYSLETRSVVSRGKVDFSHEVEKDEALIELIVQAKLFKGDLYFSQQELLILEEWLRDHEVSFVEKLKEYYSQYLLARNPRNQSQYPGSKIEEVFSKVIQALGKL